MRLGRWRRGRGRCSAGIGCGLRLALSSSSGARCVSARRLLHGAAAEEAHEAATRAPSAHLPAPLLRLVGIGVIVAAPKVVLVVAVARLGRQRGPKPGALPPRAARRLLQQQLQQLQILRASKGVSTRVGACQLSAGRACALMPRCGASSSSSSVSSSPAAAQPASPGARQLTASSGARQVGQTQCWKPAEVASCRAHASCRRCRQAGPATTRPVSTGSRHTAHGGSSSSAAAAQEGGASKACSRSCPRAKPAPQWRRSPPRCTTASGAPPASQRCSSRRASIKSTLRWRERRQE